MAGLFLGLLILFTGYALPNIWLLTGGAILSIFSVFDKKDWHDVFYTPHFDEEYFEEN